MQKEYKTEEAPLTLNIPLAKNSVISQSAPVSPRITRSNSNQPTTMAELDLNTLFKFVKPYDGSRETVNSFIINCNNAYELASETQKPILFKYILSQLQGKAEIACSIKEFKEWNQLKEFLKTQFSERKHYAHLLTELQESRQGPHDNVSQFALRVETCLSQLLTEVSLSNTKIKEIPGRAAAMEDLALHHFLMGLHPRISNIVRCRSPKTLNEAINLAISEERIQQSLYKRPQGDQKPNNNNNRFNNRQNSNSNSFKPNQNTPSTSQRATNVAASPPIVCRYCKIPGHDISVCRKREYNNNRFKVSQNQGANQGQGTYTPYRPRVNFVTDQGEDEVDNNADLSPINTDDNDLNE